MDPALSDPATWTPLLTSMRHRRPAEASLEFNGTLTPNSCGGSWSVVQADGSAGPIPGGREDQDPLQDLWGLVGQSTVGLTARVDRDGKDSVTLFVLDDSVSAGFSTLISSIRLVPDAVPEPFRRSPEWNAATVALGLDPKLVRWLVGKALPDADGLTPRAIDDWQRRTGLQLPSDVRALFETANGGDLAVPGSVPSEDGERPEQSKMRISPLDQPDQWFAPTGRYGGDWRFGATTVIPPDPDGRIQAVGFSSAWVLLGDDWGGNLFVADLAPGPRGTVGQILFLDHETPEVLWVAESVTEWLATDIDLYLNRPPLPGQLVRINASPPTLDAVVDATEVLIVNKVETPLDLRPLAGHPRLRTLEVAGGEVAGLEVIGSLPKLEYLAVGPADWRHLLQHDLLPSTLLAAGVSDDLLRRPRPSQAEVVALTNDLLTRWGRPPLQVIPVR